MGTAAQAVSSGHGLLAGVVAAAFSRALDCAEEFVGATSPNPPVGCVLLDRDGAVLAAEAHRRAGEAHAEARAIAAARQAGAFGRIHTAVVTLEPCNHWGRTPPCTEAILASGARAVWIGASDPNPAVVGGGAQRLAAAGLDVRFIRALKAGDASALAARAERLAAPFAKRARTGLPWITVKQALDRGGSMIPPPGAKTFTSDASLRFAHALRRRADAILTGSGTVLADAPEFTVRRVPDFPLKRRALAVLDRRGRVPEGYFHAAGERGLDAWRARSPEGALERLGRAGALEVLVEAGPALTGALLKAGLWDEHVVIEQGQPGAQDVITTCRAPARKEDEDVFRHR
jgi:diaminohydroxyphosphoribosylaminopyrimidine deaminase / 5-amino-6-(5-phosphoribosylamino)uracil reductase